MIGIAWSQHIGTLADLDEVTLETGGPASRSGWNEGRAKTVTPPKRSLRREGPGRYTAFVELHFEGDDPLKGWREFEFGLEHCVPNLDTDLAERTASP